MPGRGGPRAAYSGPARVRSEVSIRPSGLYGEWFALYGDTVEDQKEAFDIYKMGVRSVPNYHGNYPRWLGASILGGLDKRVLQSELEGIDQKRLALILHWADQAKYPKQIDFKRRPYVIRRFSVGRGFLADNLKSPHRSLSTARERAPA